MARKQIKVTRRVLITWFMLAGLIFLFTPQKFTGKIQSGFADIFCWPLRIGRGVSLSARTQTSAQEAFRHKESLYQNHIINLRAQLEQARRELERLSGLRNRLPLEKVRLMPAGVITASLGQGHNEFIINRGKDDGLAAGQFVIGDNSIVGTLSEVWQRTARVKLITDTGFSAVVNVKGLEKTVLMHGGGADTAKIRLAQNQVGVGREVIAGKKAGFLNTAMIIGKVEDCQRNTQNPLLWDITVEPACRIENLTDVAVMIVDSQQ